MMVKIIQRGSLPEERDYIAQCKNCHTKFEFHYSEAHPTNFDGGFQLDIACPLCKKIVSITCGVCF